MFYRQQAMRLSTYGHPRVISCADETKDYLCLPRGCEHELSRELQELGIDFRIIDKTYSGKTIDAAFNGRLRDEQPLALENLLQHDTGILSGTTAFGKTIVAIKLIAEKKVNTLILVDKVNLLSQWKDKLSEFLVVNEPLFNQDISTAKKEILIVSPFIRKRRTVQMMNHLKIAAEKNIRVIVVTRPSEDFNPEGAAALHGLHDLLKNNGIQIVFKSNIHQKFAIMDQNIIWYGSINLLSYGSAQESIMRIESYNIANELINSIESL